MKVAVVGELCLSETLSNLSQLIYLACERNRSTDFTSQGQVCVVHRCDHIIFGQNEPKKRRLRASRHIQLTGLHLARVFFASTSWNIVTADYVLCMYTKLLQRYVRHGAVQFAQCLR